MALPRGAWAPPARAPGGGGVRRAVVGGTGTQPLLRRRRAVVPRVSSSNQAQEQWSLSRLLPLRRRRAVVARASSSNQEQEQWSLSRFLPLGDGDAILLPRARAEVGPSYELSRDEAIAVQLAALADNDKPFYDHGIEVLYRFANFDPFQRARYFGKSFDLGQFERFRRILHIPAYKPLLGHEGVETLSALQLSERVWKTRFAVRGEAGREQGVYEITMVQRLGGRYDGYWFTESLVADGNDWKAAQVTF
ncbi:hypothetical protein HT031_000852 [Scenedesmus sp. PABB004]|nr:hypothetical protein HT031_000852 [Scenedesmus sp. PABB004]